MQAITTKFIPASNCKGSRIKAKCERGSITIDYPHDCTGDEAHARAAQALCNKFLKEDGKAYESNNENNPWSKPRIVAGLPNGDTVHVFSAFGDNPMVIQFSDQADTDNFKKCVGKAKSTEGTFGGLYAGLLCSALKRAKI